MYKKYKPWIIIGVVVIMIVSVVMMVAISSNNGDYYGYDQDIDNGYYSEGGGARDKWATDDRIEVAYDAEEYADIEVVKMKAEPGTFAMSSSAPTPSVVEIDMNHLNNRAVYAGEIGKMIKKDATMSIQGANPFEIYSQARMKALAVGGGVTDYNENHSKYDDVDYITISCTLTIPTGDFDNLLNAIREMGDVTDQNISTDDVTAEYYDLQSDLANRKRAIAELEKIYAKAKNVEDSLSVYYQIQDIQREVDRIQGKMNYLQTVSSESRIHMTITQPDEDTVTPPTTSRFMRGLQRLWNDIQDGVVWLIGFLIMLVFIGIVAFLLVLLGIFIYRKVKSSLGNKQLE
ncbi:MAG: DUF4349 domain-containing protein [Caldisericia bacterium]